MHQLRLGLDARDIDDKIKDAVEQANKRAGYRRFRSKAHFVEWCVSQLCEENSKKVS